MRVVVDLNRCQSYGQCVFAAPAVFEFRGEESLEYEPAPDEALRADIERAAAFCPVGAIRIQPAGIVPLAVVPGAIEPTAPESAGSAPDDPEGPGSTRDRRPAPNRRAP